MLSPFMKVREGEGRVVPAKVSHTVPAVLLHYGCTKHNLTFYNAGEQGRVIACVWRTFARRFMISAQDKIGPNCQRTTKQKHIPKAQGRFERHSRRRTTRVLAADVKESVGTYIVSAHAIYSPS